MSLCRDSFSLTPRAPFDFAKTLEVLRQGRALAAANEASATHLTKALRVTGKTIVIRLGSSGSVASPRLEGTLYSLEPVTPVLKQAVLARLSFFLSLDEDLAPFYALAEPDDAFLPVLAKLYGYHQVKFPTPFACACWAIITQRTPNAFAYKTRQRLVEALGSTLTLDNQPYGAFPDPQQLLDADPKAIVLATNNLRKTERLQHVAEAFLGADENFLRHGPISEVAKWLKGIKGIGEWSVDFILLRGLGRMEHTPWNDTGLIEAVSAAYAGGLTLDRQHVKQLADLYGPWQGYWVHYLKRYLWP